MDHFIYPNKIKKLGFYCPCNTTYFNSWAKYFLYSVQQYAPWAHLHFHIFDGTVVDEQFCSANNCSYSREDTPIEFSDSLERKKDFWVNIRFVRLHQIYSDDVPVMSVDADSLLVKSFTKDEFLLDHQKSWVTTCKKREQLSLGSAVGFAADSARHILAEKIYSYRFTEKFKWCLDQVVLDEMIVEGILNSYDTKYSDFKMGDSSIIWTGKGPRKNKERYQTMIKKIMKGKSDEQIHDG